MSTPTRSTIGMASGIALAVAGGAAALFLTVGAGASADGPTPQSPPDSMVVTEYVDQYGNPVAAPANTVAPTQQPPIVIDVVDASTGETLQAATVQNGTMAPATPASYEEYPGDDEGGDHHEYDEHDEYDEHEQHEEEDDDD